MKLIRTFRPGLCAGTYMPVEHDASTNHEATFVVEPTLQAGRADINRRPVLNYFEEFSWFGRSTFGRTLLSLPWYIGSGSYFRNAIY